MTSLEAFSALFVALSRPYGVIHHQV